MEPSTEGPLPEGRLEALPASGDLLLAFGVAPRRVGRTDARTELLASAGAWGLWSQRAGEAWRGSPLSTISTRSGRLGLLVGELFGEGAAARARDLIGGERTAVDLSGHFLLLAWDPIEQVWHVWTDRFGTVHVYFVQGDGRAALGTFMPAVAEASRGRLDLGAIAAFFALGFFPGGRTQLEDVTVLRPATHTTISADGHLLRSERYWNWSFRPDERLTTGAAADGLGSVLADVVREHVESGRVAVPISGGLDSRTVAAVLPDSAHDRVRAFSYGYSPDSVEIQIGRSVAAALRLPFTSYVIEPYLLRRLDHVVAVTEGFMDITQPRQASCVQSLAATADVVLAAHWGDVWLGDLGAEERRDLDDSTFIRTKFRRPGSSWLVRHLRDAQSLVDRERSTDEMITDELSRLGQLVDREYRLKALKTELWSFRWTVAGLRAFQAGLYPRLPFYDTRVVDFLATVPSRLHRGRGLQRELLIQRSPAVARVPWQVTGRPLTDDATPAWARGAQDVARRLLSRLRRGVLGRPALRNWEVQFRSQQDELRRLLLRASGPLLDHFDPADIADLLAPPLSTWDRERGYAASMLLTFAAWLDRYHRD